MAELIKPGKGTQLYNIMQNIQPQTETLIIPYIDRYMQQKPNTGTYEVHDLYKPKDTYFHPSGDCLKCKRLLFFERNSRFTMPQEQLDVTSMRTFKVGHAVHCMVQAWIADMGAMPGFPRSKYGAEVGVLHKELNIKGSIDDILEFPNGEEVPLEIKTINSRNFATLKSPKPAHKLQVQSYLALKNLPYGILLYIEKDYPHGMKEFKVEAGDVSHVFNRWGKVMECLFADDCGPLEYECRAGSVEFNRCPAREFCRSVNH